MHLQGLEYDSKTGLIKTTWFTGDLEKSAPWFKTVQFDKNTSNKWYQSLAAKLNGPPGNTDPTKTPNITVEFLWKNKDRQLKASTKGISWSFAVMDALEEVLSGVPAARDKAEAVTNWLTGGYQYKNLLGGLTKTEYEQDAFLNAEKCYGYFNPQIRISDALLQIKEKNPAAHDWVVRAAGAKAAAKAAHEATMYQKTIDMEKAIVAKPVVAAGKAVEATVDVATGAIEGTAKSLSVLAFIARNWLWFAGGILVVGGVIVYINREKVAKIAAGAAAGGPAGAALAAVSNPKKRSRKAR